MQVVTALNEESVCKSEIRETWFDITATKGELEAVRYVGATADKMIARVFHGTGPWTKVYESGAQLPQPSIFRPLLQLGGLALRLNVDKIDSCSRRKDRTKWAAPTGPCMC